MAIFSSSQPSLRTRVLARFPAQVLAGNGMIITKNGGTYIFEATGEVTSLNDLPDISSNSLLGRTLPGVGPVHVVAIGNGLISSGVSIVLSPNQLTRTLQLTLTSPSAGMQRDIWVPFAGQIIGATLLMDVVAGSTFDLWKAPYASYPPVVGNSICGGNKLSTTGAQNKTQNTLVGWTTAVSAGDIIRVNCDGTSPTPGRATIAIDVRLI